MKILIIGASNLGPYHFVRYKEAAKLIPGLIYVRIFLKEFYRPWSNDIKDFPLRIINKTKKKSMISIFKEENPKVLITIGYSGRAILIASIWAKIRKIPVILQADSTYYDHKRNRIKEFIKSLIVRNLYTAAFSAGKRSGDYLHSLGIPRKRIWYGLDVVDNRYFEKSLKIYKLPKTFPKRYFLLTSRLSSEKNIERLIKAFEIYRNKKGSWGLIIAGDGPLRNILQKKVSKEISNALHFTGWLNYTSLPSLYNSASCFILPSISETWGLTVNEAMAARLPVLVSEKCGCVPELCQNGINGYSFDPYNVEEIVQKMLEISSNEKKRRAMGNASKKIIKAFTPENWAKTLLDIIKNL